MDSNESFLSRWARRKAEQQSDIPEADDISAPAEALSEQPTVAPDDLPPPPSDEDMPAIESLDESSDYSQFFSPNVSEALRQQALKKLFRLPEFNVRDGLNDYDGDFSQMPALSAEVAQQLRSWFDEQKEAFHEALNEEESPAPESETNEDDNAVGDADLAG